MAADHLAGRGAALGAPPAHLLHRARLRLNITRTVQKLAVHQLAIYHGHLKSSDEDGHEACWTDEQLGLCDVNGAYDELDIPLEDELMDEVMAAEAVHGNEHQYQAEWDETPPCDLDNPDADVQQPTHCTTINQQEPRLPTSSPDPCHPNQDNGNHQQCAQQSLDNADDQRTPVANTNDTAK